MWTIAFMLLSCLSACALQDSSDICQSRPPTYLEYVKRNPIPYIDALERYEQNHQLYQAKTLHNNKSFI